MTRVSNTGWGVNGELAQRVRGAHATEIDSLIQYEIFSGAAEGKSQSTIDLTVLTLKTLKRFLQRNSLPLDLNVLGPQELRSFILDLQGSKRYEQHRFTRRQETQLSRQTVNAYLRAIRAAWNRWVSDGLVESSPFQQLKIPRVQRKVIPTFTPAQLKDLLAAVDTSTPEGFRDHLLILMYLDTAGRLSEITNLRICHVDMKLRCIKVLGKGQRERVVPIGAKVQKLLWKYINMYRPEPITSRYDQVFLTGDGRPLSKNRVEEIMHKYGKKAGITGVRCSPHTLRHTACLMWVREGGDIFVLQQITGHSSLEVLRGYVNLAQSDVSQAHRKYSPVDNLEI